MDRRSSAFDLRNSWTGCLYRTYDGGGRFVSESAVGRSSLFKVDGVQRTMS